MFNRNVGFDFPEFPKEWYNERKKIDPPKRLCLGLA